MNLLELVQSQLTEELVAPLAESLGESASRTQQALSAGAIPAVLGALQSRHGAPSAGDDLVQLLVAGRHDGGMLGQLSSAFGGGPHTSALLNVGKGLIATLLGTRADAVTELIASSTSLRRSSASALLGLAAPLALAVLGRERIERKLDATGLRALLAGLPVSWKGHALPGLEIALGTPESDGLPARSRPFWAWIVVPVAVALATFGLRNCQQLALQAARAPAIAPQVKPLPAVPVAIHAPVTAPPATEVVPMSEPALSAAPVAPAASEAAPTTAEPATATSAVPAAAATAVPATASTPTPTTAPAPTPTATLDAITAGIDKSSVAYELAQFLVDPAASAPRSFVLRNLNFDSGTADITRASRRTLQDVATVLKAFPSAKVMLQGHTDSVGDPNANYDLSLARAGAAQAALQKLGVEESRLSNAGFGADRPLQPNDTAEGRALNRRTELLVIVK